MTETALYRHCKVLERTSRPDFPFGCVHFPDPKWVRRVALTTGLEKTCPNETTRTPSGG